MAIEIEPVSRWRQATLRNLWQFYLYEYTRFTGWPIPEDGRYAEDDLDGCWTDPKRHPFFIRVDGALGGFCIVDERPVSKLTGTPEIRELTELFVFPALRKRGLAAHVATRLFDQHPGRWELGVMNGNDALAFWRKLLARYTSGRFREQPGTLGHWQGLVMSFDNAEWATRGA